MQVLQGGNASEVYSVQPELLHPCCLPLLQQTKLAGSFIYILSNGDYISDYKHYRCTHLSRVAEVFSFIHLIHSDNPSDIFLLHQLQQNRSSLYLLLINIYLSLRGKIMFLQL